MSNSESSINNGNTKIKDDSESSNQKLTLLKKGDYSIHVLIEEVKNLLEIEENKLPTPVVKITCFEESKRSEKPDSPCDSYSYEEHFYFEKTNLTVEQLDSSKIIIEVYDYKNSSKRSNYFGIYEYDIAYIYDQENHSLRNFWLALANPESNDMTKVRGYLKLSISVLHDNDPRVELEINKDSYDCFLPSQIKMQYKLLSIYIMKGENLPDMDSTFKLNKVNKPCDAFIEINYLGLKKKTSVIQQKNDIVEWNEIIDIPISIPTVSQKIIFLIKDYDVGKDDLIGSFEIEVNEIIGSENKYKDFTFFDIYGSPENKDSKIHNLMNKNSEIGSKWNGRILLKIDCFDVDSPQSQVRKIEDENIINSAKNLARKNLWSVYVKLYSAYYLPNDNDSYSIGISMQDNNIVFNSKKANKGCIDWKECKNLQCQTLSNNKNELPDLFIYLYNSKKEAICFQRIKSREFHLNEQIMVIKLFPDPCFDQVKEIYKSGLIKIKICIINKGIDREINLKFRDGDSEDLDNNESSEDLEELIKLNNKNKKNKKELYSIVCVIYMSRYIISSDSDGTNDPFVTLKCLEVEKKTNIKHNTINGIWNEKLIFDDIDMDINKKSTWPIFLLKVLDYDNIGSDDILGYNYVWLSDSHYLINKTDLIKPKWSQLYLPKSNRPQGEILLSFYILSREHRSLFYNISSIPETIPYSFEINILGLRDLKPLSLLPVKKAYIKFDMNSLNISGKEEDSLKEIITLPKDYGSSPTINSVIKFDLNLPKDEIFMPELQCEIYDHLFSGFINPLLGVFLLNIKQLIKNTNKQINEDMNITINQVNELQNSGVFNKNLQSNLIDNNEKKSGSSGNSTHNLIDVNDKENVDKTNNIIDENSIALNIKNSKNNNEYNPQLSYIARNITHVSNIDYDDDLLNKNKHNSEYFVLLPKFKKFKIPGLKKKESDKLYEIEDIENSPPSNLFMGIGYNKLNTEEEDLNGNKIKIDKTKVENISKHYRRFYGVELERVFDLKVQTPFHLSYVRRGKEKDYNDETAIFSAISEINNKIIKAYPIVEDKRTYEEIEKDKLDEKKRKRLEFKELLQENILPKNLRNRDYGVFKSVIRIAEKSKMDEYTKLINNYKKDNPEILNELKNITKYEKLTKAILIKQEVIIRLYILQLRDLPNKDIGSESDPYIKIYLGSQLKINEKDNYIENSNNADWYKYYDIITEFPGESTIKIEVWDNDPIFKDELIGSTKIDLEDRFYQSNWRDLKYKPIETRNLYHPDLQNIQGNIILWVEILEKKDISNIQPWEISKEPQKEIEMRLIIWETENMKNLDFEGTSDIYINAYINPKIKQSTDVHYRCTDGNASFNWRIVIPINLPDKNSNYLNLQCYDKDIFSSDDFICGSQINITNLLMIPKDLNLPIKFNKDYYSECSEKEKEKYKNIEFLSGDDENKFWVQCYKKNEKEGRILCSLEFLPKWKADLCKVGLGRKEPNIEPYLPPPNGRFQWSLNPFKTLNQCVGPSFRRKMYCWICAIFCLLYLAFLIPYMILHFFGQISNPFNYRK